MKKHIRIVVCRKTKSSLGGGGVWGNRVVESDWSKCLHLCGTKWAKRSPCHFEKQTSWLTRIWGEGGGQTSNLIDSFTSQIAVLPAGHHSTTFHHVGVLLVEQSNSWTYIDYVDRYSQWHILYFKIYLWKMMNSVHISHGHGPDWCIRW